MYMYSVMAMLCSTYYMQQRTSVCLFMVACRGQVSDMSCCGSTQKTCFPSVTTSPLLSSSIQWMSHFERSWRVPACWGSHNKLRQFPGIGANAMTCWHTPFLVLPWLFPWESQQARTPQFPPKSTHPRSIVTGQRVRRKMLTVYFFITSINF